jgi:hypothetical protein
MLKSLLINLVLATFFVAFWVVTRPGANRARKR